MNSENSIYVAYGSNLNLEQMEWRCPYAKVLGNAELRDYQLLFRGGNGGSVATVEPKKDSSVPVLLWDITPRDEEALDRYEGWPHLYRKETVTVYHKGKAVKAMAYIMNVESPKDIGGSKSRFCEAKNMSRPLGSPSEGYLNTILEGYRSAGFDEKVLEQAVKDSAGGRAK